MPNFSEAKVAAGSGPVDLTPYVNFLRNYEGGTCVTVPLEQGEKKRMIMRYFNKAAAANGQKLFTMRGDATTIAFRVVRPTGPRGGKGTASRPSPRTKKTAQAAS